MNLVESFRGASRFRNLVTYQTAIVDDSIVLQVLREHLVDFGQFLSQVAEWVHKRPQ